MTFLNACRNGQKSIVQIFLKKGGIDVNKRDAEGNTPLYYACLKGFRDIVSLLLDSDADVSIANNCSETPLHAVARSGNKEIIGKLVQYGAELDATDKEGRTPLICLLPWYRKLSDYLALFLILPVLMTASSGLSIFLSTLQNSFISQYFFFTPLVELILNITPYLITILAFTGLYISLPNTKVRFVNGLVAGILSGIAFQFFQFIYISGQIWVSKYNAIYGSFAALPLLLLWLQLSWLICLFGAEISYASQNVKKFSFERDSKNISRRYKDFLTLLIASLIVKRFVKGEKPYTADELSDAYRIPIRITTQILYQLTELHIIIEVNYGDDERVVHYQPAIDVNKITVSYLLTRMDEYGSENFKIDTSKLFSKEWKALLKTREDMIKANDNILLKDL
mgnify:CR=1 FL=1